MTSGTAVAVQLQCYCFSKPPSRPLADSTAFFWQIVSILPCNGFNKLPKLQQKPLLHKPPSHAPCKRHCSAAKNGTCCASRQTARCVASIQTSQTYPQCHSQQRCSHSATAMPTCFNNPSSLALADSKYTAVGFNQLHKPNQKPLLFHGPFGYIIAQEPTRWMQPFERVLPSTAQTVEAVQALQNRWIGSVDM